MIKKFKFKRDDIVRFGYQSIAAVGAVLSTLGTPQLAGAIVTFGDSSLNQVGLGEFSGVVLIGTPNTICTGSLLKGGLHILTAAHCITDEQGKFETNIFNRTTAIFNLSTGSVPVPVVNFFVHPNYDGLFFHGNDIAVLQLAQPAPSEAQRYEIYRNQDEVGQIFTQVGYGYIGTGATGRDTESNPFALAYYGQNRFDALGDVFNPLFRGRVDGFTNMVPGSQLLFDFDSGSTINDAFGVHFGINDVGLQVWETNIAEGDSGAPALLGNLIAGIASYGFGDSFLFSDGFHTDFDMETNASFGEFASTTRVSRYAQFIDDAIAGKVRSAVAKSRLRRRFRRLSSSSSIGWSTVSLRQQIDQSSKTIPESSSIIGMLAFGVVAFGFFCKSKDKR